MNQNERPIAVGNTAEIYAWKEDQVLKLFKAGISRSTVEAEARLGRIAQATGLPVPAVGEIRVMDHRFGLEYERVDGITMLQALLQEPWKFSYYSRLLAELHWQVHQQRVPEMPSQREKLERKVRQAELLPEDLRQAALEALAHLPEGDRLCHGDFHPGNILLSAHGPVIIDWLDASRGSPLIDVARTTILFGGGPLPPGTPMAWLIRILRRWSYQVYRKRYFQLGEQDRTQLFPWLPLIAAARLDEGIPGEDDRLLSIAMGLRVR